MCKTCQEILLPLSENKEDWNKAKHEWDQEATRDYEHKCECICGHDIEHNFVLENKINNNGVIVGSVCVNTVFVGCNVLLDSVNKYTCDICNKKILRSSKKAHEESQKHIDNQTIRENWRKCEDCNKYEIKITEPAFKKKCIICFKLSKGLKKCWGCNIWRKIGKSYAYCYKCNMDRKEYKKSIQNNKTNI